MMFFGITNFTDIMNNFMNWSMQGYEIVLGVLMWPLFFSGVIGYVYMKQQSVVAIAVVIMIIVAGFINAFVGVEPFLNVLYIVVALCFTGLVVVFLTKVRR